MNTTGRPSSGIQSLYGPAALQELWNILPCLAGDPRVELRMDSVDQLDQERGERRGGQERCGPSGGAAGHCTLIKRPNLVKEIGKFLKLFETLIGWT